jgi:ferrochelatase
VRRYLREFLSDPRVLDISPLGRWLLLNLIILPTRPARSAEAYRKIWTADGSPLLVHSRALCRARPRGPARISRSSSPCATASPRSAPA